MDLHLLSVHTDLPNHQLRSRQLKSHPNVHLHKDDDLLSGVPGHSFRPHYSLTQASVIATEQERKRIAQDLHDGVCQMLAGVSLRLESLSQPGEVPSEKDLQAVKQMVDQTLSEIRSISHNLSSCELDKHGFYEALRRLCHKTEALGNEDEDLRVAFEYTNDEHFDPTIQIFIYRIVQELLHNTQKHANASNIQLKLKCINHRIELHFRDNGIGMQLNSDQFGHGLNNISSRVTALTGTFEISSAPGKGVYCLITLPTGP